MTKLLPFQRYAWGHGMAPPDPRQGRAAIPNFRQTDDVTPLSDTHAV